MIAHLASDAPLFSNGAIKFLAGLVQNFRTFDIPGDAFVWDIVCANVDFAVADPAHLISLALVIVSS